MSETIMVHFDTTIRGMLTSVCGCGYVGEPIDNWDGLKTNYECPKCGEEAKMDMILDMGTGYRTVTKKWPDGKTYEKKIKTNVMELRLASDPRNMSEWVANKGASAILWEVLRALEPNMPKKPKMKEFKDKDAFFAARKEYKAFWRNAFRKEYTINDLLKGKTKIILEKNNPHADNDPKAQTRAILVALGIDLKKVKMSSKFAFVSMASKLADKRAVAATKVVKAMMARTTVNALMENKKFFKHLELADFIMGLNIAFGNIAIRASVLKSMKNKNGEFLPGYHVIRTGTYRAFEKSTWKHKAFMDAHPEFFASPEFSMDRGKEVIMDDGSAWMYDPVWNGMMQIAGPMPKSIDALRRGHDQKPLKTFEMVSYSEAIGEDYDEEDDIESDPIIEEDIDEGSLIDESDSDDEENCAVA